MHCCTVTMQEEYNNEAINWSHIEFVDNQEALDIGSIKLNAAIVGKVNKSFQGTATE